MTQKERLAWLIEALAPGTPLPEDGEGRWRLFRSLVNVRPPAPASAGFLRVQDAFLREIIRARGITDAAGLTPLRGALCLWRGDITALRADAIVNAANSALLGCFCPCHGCIDNAIHTFAGVQLRLACAALMERQGHPEPPGHAKITPGFNLPARYVLHTVGPIVTGMPDERDRGILRACYRSCLETAASRGLRRVAFCCIGTGEFHFPRPEAAAIAVQTAEAFLRAHPDMTVIFNVFTPEDEALYRALLT